MGTRTDIDWASVDFSEPSDSKLARQLGVTAPAVRYQRLKRVGTCGPEKVRTFREYEREQAGQERMQRMGKRWV